MHKEIIIITVSENGDFFEFASKELHNNKEIVKIPLTQYNYSFQHTSNYREILIITVYQY